MNKIRSFIAIEIPAPIIDKIKTVQTELKSLDADVRWVKPESIHLTLKFLGDVEEGRVERISQVLARKTENENIMPVELKGLGVFPHFRNPRVVWAGIRDEERRLVSFQKIMEKGLKSVGFKPEKRSFSPHLTLGRFKSFKKREELIEKLEKLEDYSFGFFAIDKIFLFKSELRKEGAVHTKLATFEFFR